MWSPPMRPTLVSLLLAVAAAPLFGQGWIIPRPCGLGIVPADIRPDVRPTPPMRDCAANISRTRSDVHVELA